MRVKWEVPGVQFRGVLWVIIGGRGYRWEVDGIIKTERSAKCLGNADGLMGIVRWIGFGWYLNMDWIWIAF